VSNALFLAFADVIIGKGKKYRKNTSLFHRNLFRHFTGKKKPSDLA
jgi:hypothetical protein